MINIYSTLLGFIFAQDQSSISKHQKENMGLPFSPTKGKDQVKTSIKFGNQ